MARKYNFCFTYNNYDDEGIHRIKSVKSKYIVFGKEIGESGTPHLQGFVSFKDARSEKSVRKDFPGCHITVANGTPGTNRDYCCKGSQPKAEWDDKGKLGPNYGKDADIYEEGTVPLSNKEAQETRWRDAIAAVSEERFDDVPDDLLGRLRDIDYAVSRMCKKRKVEELEEMPVCKWYWGPTGTGKSHRVGVEAPGAYRKDVNTRQWDDYNGENAIYFEDVDESFAVFGGDLKRIADKYPFTIKQIYKSTEKIRPTAIYVTSNMPPSDIWKNVNILVPIERRFDIVHMTTVFEGARADPPHPRASEATNDQGVRPVSPGRREFMEANGW